LICRQDRGHADVFQCFYHAWSFNTRGELVGLPDEAGYGAGFDRSERALRQVPRLEEYRGLYFVSFNPDIIDLPDYLGGAREYIDLVMDEAESGMRIVPGSNKYSIRANWKLLGENSLDGYHGLPTHQTYWEYMQSLGVNTTRNLSQTRARDLGNGHAVIEGPAPYGRPIAHWSPLFGEEAKPEIERIRARLVERHGEERANRMSSTIRNLLIYPNLVLNDIMSVTVRIFWPVQPDLMEVTAWELAPVEERADILDRRLDSFLTFLGPGGFATPDDAEALESCQMGFKAKEVEW
jgi:p-cumate 2,3-dioxygenase alpha subunit